jgi:hypothetical protein
MNGIRAQLNNTRSKSRSGRSPTVTRQRLRSPEIDAASSSSALGALATGLTSIGEKFTRRRHSLRVP